MSYTGFRGGFPNEFEDPASLQTYGDSVSLDPALDIRNQPCIYSDAKVRRILILNASLAYGLGDHVIANVFPTLVLRKFPDAEIFILTRYPELYSCGNKLSPATFQATASDDYDVNCVSRFILRKGFDLVYDIDSYILNSGWCKDMPFVVGTDIAKKFGKKVRQWIPRREMFRHTSLNAYEIVRFVFLRLGLPAEMNHLPQLTVSPKTIHASKGVLHDISICLEKPLILINPCGSIKYGIVKETSLYVWEAFFQELDRHLYPMDSIDFAVHQGIDERHKSVAHQLVGTTKLNYNTASIKMLPRVNLSILTGLVALSHTVVTVDTSIAHIAPALNVPTLVLFPRKEFPSYRWKHPHAIGVDVKDGNVDIDEIVKHFLRVSPVGAVDGSITEKIKH